MNELNELGTSFGTLSPQNLYEVPTGYFEGLPARIMNRIKALEASDAREELEYLSPLLSDASRKMPYEVPAGFFQNFAGSVMQQLNENASHKTSAEEIESLSPLLSGLKNKNPFTVPAGYFDSLETTINPDDSSGTKKNAKVIALTTRRWYRVALAAAVIGIVAITGLMLFNGGGNGISIDKNPQAWVKKNVINKVSEEKIDEFVTLVAPNETQKPAGSEAAAEAEIKELMKDVSQKEIDDFLNDAVALESTDDPDALLN